jgi:hypothetical protein
LSKNLYGIRYQLKNLKDYIKIYYFLTNIIYALDNFCGSFDIMGAWIGNLLHSGGFYSYPACHRRHRPYSKIKSRAQTLAS